MRRTKNGMGIALLSGLLALGALAPTVGWSQTSEPLQDVEKRLIEKRAAAAAHRTQMEGIKDPEKLLTEMQRHFQRTEEVLALLLERRKLLGVPAPASGTPSGQRRGMQGGGMQGGGMMQKAMGSMAGGGMREWGMQGGGMMPQAMGSITGGGRSGQPAPDAQGSTATIGSERELLQRSAEHAASMETLQDKATLVQEMFRHQKLLDQMLQLMP